MASIRKVYIEETEFETSEISLKNKNGIIINIIDFGAIISGIFTPDREGEFSNIVLGYEDYSNYIINPPYLGAIVGRVAGRLSGAKLQMDGIEYGLEDNNGGNTLHGGSSDFSKKKWKIEEFSEDQGDGTDWVKLSLESMDMEGGFPGALEVESMFSLNDEDELKLEIKIGSSKKTYANPANHTYFNLGSKEDVREHEIMVDSSQYAMLDGNSIPIGGWTDVQNTCFDLRQPVLIGDVLECDEEQLASFRGIDHPFRLGGDINKESASLVDQKSGRSLSIRSNQKSVVIYSGNYLDENPIGPRLKRHAGICFEFQQVPNAPNEESFETIYIDEEKIYEHTTIYKFGVKN